jgi:quinol monooxygenase YgiN
MLSCAIDLRIAPQTTRYRSSSGRRVVETVTEGAVRKPRQRESYLAGCVSVVEQARAAAGCFDFAITADPIDPGRVNVFERWESQEALETFRGSGPGNEQAAAMLSVSVAEYDIVDVRPLFGEGTA